MYSIYSNAFVIFSLFSLQINKPMEEKKKQSMKISKKPNYEKKTKKRNASAEEVVYIFRQVLLQQRPVQIYNAIKRQTPESKVTKQWVEKIYTGNCFVSPNEFQSKNEYEEYCSLREKVYEYHREKKAEKKKLKQNQSLEHETIH